MFMGIRVVVDQALVNTSEEQQASRQPRNESNTEIFFLIFFKQKEFGLCRNKQCFAIGYLPLI